MLEMSVWILNHVLRSVTWSLLTLKPNLVQITTLNVIVHVVVSVCQFETRPSSLHSVGMAYYKETTPPGFKLFYFVSQ